MRDMIKGDVLTIFISCHAYASGTDVIRNRWVVLHIAVAGRTVLLSSVLFE